MNYFDNTLISIISLMMLGVSSCLIVIPSLSDLMIGINIKKNNDFKGAYFKLRF